MTTIQRLTDETQAAPFSLQAPDNMWDGTPIPDEEAADMLERLSLSVKGLSIRGSEVSDMQITSMRNNRLTPNLLYTDFLEESSKYIREVGQLNVAFQQMIMEYRSGLRL
jgi:hypothetical protein